MYTKEPVWLCPEEILIKYNQYCYEHNINKRFITKLFDANLLRGRTDRKSHRIEILEESWLDLLILIDYNLDRRKYHSDTGALKLYTPPSCNYTIEQLRTEQVIEWKTPTDLIKSYDHFLHYEKVYTAEFVGDLIDKGIVRGKYDETGKCYQVLVPSFIDLIKYREYTITQNLFFPLDGK